MRKLLLLLVCCALLTAQLLAQSRVVTGKVTDANGNPVPNASVQVKGTKVGTTTNADGSYSFSVPANARTLVISSVGMAANEVSIGSGNVVNSIMKAEDKNLQEVVVTGYTQVNRKKAVTSYSEVKAEKIQNVPLTNINEILQGQAPGLQINTISGQPGSSQNVRIRGVGSFSGGSPVYVIDGIIIERGQFIAGSGGQQSSDILANLNPNDIENVTVLKDASALALYGSRAGNGAIVITTKKGKAGASKTTVSAQYGFTDPSFGNWKMMTPREVLNYERDVLALNGRTQAQIDALYPNNDSMVNNAFDWADAAFQRGITQNYQVSNQGGNDKTKHYIALGYFNQEGTILRSEFERYTVQSNIQHQATRRLGFEINLNITYGNTLNGDAGNRFASPLLGAFVNNPLATKPYAPDGTLYTGREPQAGFNVTRDNFLYNGVRNYNRQGQYRTFGKFNVNYRLFDWLRFNQDVAMDYIWSKEKVYFDPTTSDGFNNRGDIRESLQNAYTLTSRSNLSGTKNFGDDHTLDYYAGLEWIRYNNQFFNAQGINLPPGGLQALNVAALPQAVGGGATDYAFLGYLANLNYTFRNKYYLTTSFRRDGSSRFGENQRFANFWSVGASWQITQEDFMKNQKVFDDLKLRASYGTSGNAEFDNFVNQQLYALTVAYNGNPGSVPSTIGNPDLTWEKIATTNIGLDFSMLKGRIRGSIDVYRRLTTEALQNVPVSSTTGFTSAQLNVGELENRGLEVMINTINVESANGFRWTTDLNFSTNRNEVLRLFNNADIVSGNQIRRVGHPIDSWFLREWAGVNPANGAPQWFLANKTRTGSWSAAERQIVGTPYPTWQGGMTNTFSYKGVSLGFFLFGVTGIKVLNSTKTFADSDGQRFGWNYHADADNNYWRKPGDLAERPRPVIGGNNLSNSASTRFLEDGSYLRLRNVNLAYDFSRNVTSKMKIQGLRFYVMAQNLFTWTGYSGVDPEMGIDGVEFFKYPVPKAVTFGLDVTF